MSWAPTATPAQTALTQDSTTTDPYEEDLTNTNIPFDDSFGFQTEEMQQASFGPNFPYASDMASAQWVGSVDAESGFDYQTSGFPEAALVPPSSLPLSTNPGYSHDVPHGQDVSFDLSL